METEAAWTLATLLGGRPTRRDGRGAPARTHDFDIVCGYGRVIALEVTSSVVPEVVQFWDAVEALDWQFPGLSRSWSVSLNAPRPGYSGTNVRRFHHEAPALFSALSQDIDGGHRDYFHGPPHPSLGPAAIEAIGKLKALGVRNGSPIDTMTGDAAVILVGSVGPGGWTDGRSVNEAVAKAAVDNLDKLLQAEADERHLFLWVDATDNASNVAMATFSVPTDVPSLPDGIDVVWVGLWMPGVDPESYAHSLWCLRVGATAWERPTKPAVRSYARTVVAGQT